MIGLQKNQVKVSYSYLLKFIKNRPQNCICTRHNQICAYFIFNPVKKCFGPLKVISLLVVSLVYWMIHVKFTRVRTLLLRLIKTAQSTEENNDELLTSLLPQGTKFYAPYYKTLHVK